MRDATVKPQISPTLFAGSKIVELDVPHQANVSKRRNEVSHSACRRSASDDFGDEGIDDDALLNVSLGDLEFDHIENYANPMDLITKKNTAKNKATKASNLMNHGHNGDSNNFAAPEGSDQPMQLENGKWACNHPCKDKTGCKHLCCKTGLDKPPKKKALTKHTPSDSHDTHLNENETSPTGRITQTKLQLTASKRKSSAPIEELDLTQQEKKRKAGPATNGTRDYRDLHRLHEMVQGVKLPQSLHSVMHTKPAYCYSEGDEHSLTFLTRQCSQQPQTESDYGEISFDDMTPQSFRPHSPMTQTMAEQLGDVPHFEEYSGSPVRSVAPSQASETFGEDDSLLGDVMIGVLDSQDLRTESDKQDWEVDHENGFLSCEDTQLDLTLQLHGNTIRGLSENGKVAERGPWDEVLSQQSANRSGSKEGGSQPILQHNMRVNGVHKVPGLGELESSQITPHVDATSKEKYDEVVADEILDMLEVKPLPAAKAEDEPKAVPDTFKDLEPWLFKEFGDIVELVDE